MKQIVTFSLALAFYTPLLFGAQQTLAAPGDIVRVTNSSKTKDGSYSIPLPYMRPVSLSYNGSILAYTTLEGSPTAGEYSRVRVVRLANTEGRGKLAVAPEALADLHEDGTYVIGSPSLSLNGSRIAIGYGAASGDFVRVYDLDGKGGNTLAFDDGSTTYNSVNGVALSAGGRYLAFSTCKYGEYRDEGSTPNISSIWLYDLQDKTKTELLQKEFSDVDVPYVVKGITGDGSNILIARGFGESDTGAGLDQLFKLVVSTKALVEVIPSTQFGLSSPSMDQTGTLIAFSSNSSKLLARDTNRASDVFLAQFGKRALVDRVSETRSGAQGNFSSGHSSISPTGKYLVFITKSDNLVTPDNNYSADLIKYDLVRNTLTRPVSGLKGAQNNSDVRFPVISGDGSIVAFWSDATNLTPGDSNELADIFVAKIQ